MIFPSQWKKGNIFPIHKKGDKQILQNYRPVDKVWHDRIVFKLTENGISGNLVNLLRDFLNERKQRVILNGQFSTWKNVSAGVPQGSILGPLLFLIYINDLTEGLSTNAKLFEDDTSLISVIHNKLLQIILPKI